MSVEMGSHVRKDKIELDRTKLVIHDDISNKLELTLVDWDHEMTAHLSYLKKTEFGDKWPEVLGDVKRWDKTEIDYDKIITEYNDILDAIKKGQYRLHIHLGGKITFEYRPIEER